MMTAILEELESQALQLSPSERSKLIHRLIVSLDGEPAESPEAIANLGTKKLPGALRTWIPGARNGFLPMK
jgi:hypothetical protein